MAAANITTYEIPSITQNPYLGISARLRVTPAACASQTFRQINQETSGGANARIHAVEFTGPPQSLQEQQTHSYEKQSTIKSTARSFCLPEASTRTDNRLTGQWAIYGEVRSEPFGFWRGFAAWIS